MPCLFFVLFDAIVPTIFDEKYKLLNFENLPASCRFLLLGPNILLSTMFSSILSLCLFLEVREEISHPYKTKGKLCILFCVLIFTF
jgi:hypothetical protein